MCRIKLNQKIEYSYTTQAQLAPPVLKGDIMTTINWSTAATTAAAKYGEQVQNAAGQITMGLDDLMADPTVGASAKLAVIQQVAAVLANKDTLIAFLAGQAAPKATKALGGSGGSPSGDPDDLQDELDAALTRVRQLEADRKALEEVLHALGMSALPRNDTPYDANALRAAARTKKADIERAAAAAPADSVKKAAVKAKLDELKAALDAVKTSALSNRVDNLDVAKSKLTEVSGLVS